jgi:hypothetical protein
MLSKERKEWNQGEIIYIDDLVPNDHLLRKIDEAVDFSKIYDIVGKLYSETMADRAPTRWCCSKLQ